MKIQKEDRPCTPCTIVQIVPDLVNSLLAIRASFSLTGRDLSNTRYFCNSPIYSSTQAFLPLPLFIVHLRLSLLQQNNKINFSFILEPGMAFQKSDQILALHIYWSEVLSHFGNALYPQDNRL